MKTSAATVVLPRTAGKFQFRMNAVFNGMAAAEFVADMPETLAFAPGTQYTFSLKMKGGSVQLILEVLPWSGSVMSGQDNIGAFTRWLSISARGNMWRYRVKPKAAVLPSAQVNGGPTRNWMPK
ncbi:MAG: hypothetical protein ACLUHA_04195 [Bacteroides stercoris]